MWNGKHQKVEKQPLNMRERPEQMLTKPVHGLRVHFKTLGLVLAPDSGGNEGALSITHKFYPTYWLHAFLLCYHLINYNIQLNLGFC
jgi:hypothetical protein